MRRAAIQSRPDPGAPEAVGTSKARPQFLRMVQRLVDEDPARARDFLALLRQAASSGDRTGFKMAASFGDLAGTIAEAARPTPLASRPAQLSDSWMTVGRLIGTSMQKFDEQHDHHAR